MSKGVWLEMGCGIARFRAASSALLAMLILAGCAPRLQFITQDSRRPIDRKIVEYPRGNTLKTAVRGLTAPTAIAVVSEEGAYKGSIIVAESGTGQSSPRIFGWKPNGTYFSIYPAGKQIPTFGFLPHQYDIYGPIGGMVVYQGHIFVTHRDSNDRGVVSSFGFDGSCVTVVGDLPAQGDYGMGDITVNPKRGRLFFGVGAATNSGVVGLDNWMTGWVKEHPDFSDRPFVDLKLLGFKWSTKNPWAGLFGGPDNVTTAPFQAFGKNSQLRIGKSELPTSAVYSVAPTGGDVRIEGFGIRYPRGLAFSEAAALYATNDGMERRGTRPVKDDPDALVRILQSGPTWFGWPDYSTDLYPIDDPRFLDSDLVIPTGYPELTALIDQTASKLDGPAKYKSTLLYGVFPSQSGAAKLDFVPSTSSSFRDYAGNAIVALSGSRAPFATSGARFRVPVGGKIVRVNLDDRKPEEFIHNTENIPASQLGLNVDALERPIDVKFGPDGKLYILDYGKMEMRNGREKITPGTGRLFVLEPIESASK